MDAMISSRFYHTIPRVKDPGNVLSVKEPLSVSLQISVQYDHIMLSVYNAAHLNLIEDIPMAEQGMNEHTPKAQVITYMFTSTQI